MTPERRAALNAGHIKYVPSSACLNGHRIRYSKNGQCAECLLDRYNKDPDFYRQKSKEYRIKNQYEYKKTQKAWRLANKKLCLERGRRWRENNHNKKLLADRKWRDQNRDSVRTATKRWNEKNRSKLSINSIKRKKTVVVATPQWVDWESMRPIYDLASRKSSETGIKHHVDHIIPLRHRDVCGLHVTANLRVIPAADNCRKGNRWFPTEHFIETASEH